MVEEVIKGGNFNAVVHCAAWTAVDKAEDEVEACTKVNVEGTKNIHIYQFESYQQLI